MLAAVGLVAVELLYLGLVRWLTDRRAAKGRAWQMSVPRHSRPRATMVCGLTPEDAAVQPGQAPRNPERGDAGLARTTCVTIDGTTVEVWPPDAEDPTLRFTRSALDVSAVIRAVRGRTEPALHLTDGEQSITLIPEPAPAGSHRKQARIDGFVTAARALGQDPVLLLAPLATPSATASTSP